MTALRLVPLTAEHELGGFDCGNEQLNRWLAEHALASQKGDLARTYLAVDERATVGYISLTTGSVRADAAPKRYARGMPRHPIPTILIARLAVDLRYQRQRVGSRLLAEALRLAVAASDTAVARLVIVDAIDDQAAAFYRRWGFIDVPENPHRLFRKISDIRRSEGDPLSARRMPGPADREHSVAGALVPVASDASIMAKHRK